MDKLELQKQVSESILNLLDFLRDNPHELSKIIDKTNKMRLAVDNVKSGGYSKKKKNEDFKRCLEYLDRKLG